MIALRVSKISRSNLIMMTSCIFHLDINSFRMLIIRFPSNVLTAENNTWTGEIKVKVGQPLRDVYFISNNFF